MTFATPESLPLTNLDPVTSEVLLAPPRPLYRRDAPRWLGLTRRTLVPLLLLAAWAFGSRYGYIADNILASPAEVLDSGRQLLLSGVLWHHLSISLVRAALGLALGGVVGLVLGATAGLTRLGDELIDPTIQMLRAIPFLALVPLLIIWFGIGEASKVLLIAMAAGKPMYLNAYGGVRSVDPKLVEVGRVFGLSRRALITGIYLPAALPSILVGLRLAMTLALIALIAVEVINTAQGIGFLMLQAQEFFRTEIIVVCMLVYALFGLFSDLLVRGLERVLLPWNYARRGR